MSVAAESPGVDERVEQAGLDAGAHLQDGDLDDAIVPDVGPDGL